MGGRSSSSSSTLTSTTNLSSVKDQRAVADNGAVILQEGASGNTFNSTDFGAVSAGVGMPEVTSVVGLGLGLTLAIL